MSIVQTNRESHLRRYHDAGLSIIKLDGKKPIEDAWPKFANTPMTEERLVNLIEYEGNYGLAVPEGLIVLDADNQDIAGRLRQELDQLNLVYWLQWTSKGAHFVLRLPENSQAMNWVKCLVNGLELDLRVKGGQIVVEPSIHPKSGTPYRWETGKAPGDIAKENLSVLPSGWLQTNVHDSPKPTLPLDVVEESIIPEGRRNDTLFRLGCSLRAKGLGDQAILAALREENARLCQPPLTESEVQKITDQAAKYDPGQLSRAVSTEGFDESNGSVRFKVGNYTVSAKEPLKTPDGIRVSLTLENGDGPREKDLVNLYSKPSRMRFLKSCPDEHRAEIEKQVIRLADYLDQKVGKKKLQPTEEEKKPKPLTKEETQEAEALLTKENILDEFLQDVTRLGCVGDDNNKLCLYLAATSRLLDRPINITVKAESSAGKNFETESVLAFFPEEDVKIISAMTPKAFFHMENGIKNKVLMIAEAPGAEGADYSIRTMQSEGKITLLVPEKDEQGNLKTVEKLVEGPVTVIETTTRTHLHPENETRNFDVYIDESEEQTRRIFEVQNQRHKQPNPEGFRDAVTLRWRNAQRLLKPYGVIIPFVDRIPFPAFPLRVRRDRPRFMALIEASALLHQRQREIRRVHGVEFLVADMKDYIVARRIAQTILEQILGGATPKCEELVKKAHELSDKPNGTIILRVNLENELEWDRKTVNKYIREAIRLGCLDEVETGGGRGHAKSFNFVREVNEINVHLPGHEEIEANGGELPLPSAEGTDVPAVSPVDSFPPLPSTDGK